MLRNLQDKGQILILSALMLPVLLGFAGLAIDVGMLTVHRTDEQRAADAAAIAGAQKWLIVEPIEGKDSAKDAAEAEAIAYAERNGYVQGENDTTVTVSFPSTCGKNTEYVDCIKVKITHTSDTLFIRVIPGGQQFATTGASAVGAVTPLKRNYALIVLDPTQCDAFTTSSNITINGGGAIVDSDGTTGGSCAGESAVQNGGSLVTAQTCKDKDLNVIPCTLDYNSAGSWTVPNNSTASPPPTKAPLFPDPLTCGPPAGDQSAEYCPRPVPCPDSGANATCVPVSITACGNSQISCIANKLATAAKPNTTHLAGSGDVTLEPGTYYGGLDVNSASQTVHFKPGIYVFAGAEQNGSGGGFSYQAGNLCGVAIPGNSCPVAKDVTFFNTGNPYTSAAASCGAMKLTGSGNLKFAAPEVSHTTRLTGYKNMLFWQDDSCTALFTFAGSGSGGDWTQTGIIYLPKAPMKVTGGGNFGSVQIIVGTFTQGGNQEITIQFTRYIDTDTRSYKLVE